MNNKPCKNKENQCQTFSDAVNMYLYKKQMTQKNLVEKGNLTRTTVARICRNTNDKGDVYKPTHRTVMTICVALGLDKSEKDELFKIAFPEEQYWEEIIEKKMDLSAANDFLIEKGYSPLGSLK